MTKQPDEADRPQARPPADGASVAREPAPAVPPDRRSAPKRRLLIGAVGVVVLIVAGVFGFHQISLAFNTVSTDDAYVNGHVTFVAPRISGQIARVLVDDNNRVRKGDLLAQIDKEPFEVAVRSTNCSGGSPAGINAPARCPAADPGLPPSSSG